MNHDYKLMEPQPAEALAACPCCGSSARVWEYTEKDGGPVVRVAMCDHEGGCTADDAREYLIAEEGDEADAILSYRTDRQAYGAVR